MTYQHLSDLPAREASLREHLEQFPVSHRIRKDFAALEKTLEEQKAEVRWLYQKLASAHRQMEAASIVIKQAEELDRDSQLPRKHHSVDERVKLWTKLLNQSVPNAVGLVYVPEHIGSLALDSAIDTARWNAVVKENERLQAELRKKGPHMHMISTLDLLNELSRRISNSIDLMMKPQWLPPCPSSSSPPSA